MHYDSIAFVPNCVKCGQLVQKLKRRSHRPTQIIWLFYEITNRRSCLQSIYSTARFTLHVSGVLYTHHQEYNVNCIYSLRYKP